MKSKDACRLTFVFLILFSILTSTSSYAADGDMKWAFPTGGGVDSSPAIGSDGTIYVGSADNNMYAINPDGTQKWAFPTGNDVYSSPAIGSDGTIYVGSWDNNLYAINPDGTQKWAFPTGISVISSPAIGSDGTIYVGGNYYLYAINPDGTQRWAFTTGSAVGSCPAIGPDGTVYVGSFDNNLYAINPDGTEKWTFPTGSGVPSSPAICSDGTVYVGSYDFNLYAINPDGTEKWKFPTGLVVFSSPAIGSDGTIYVGSVDSNLYAINPDGTEKWTFPTGNVVLSSPAIGSDGTIYVGSQDPNLYAINPDGTERWVFPTGGGVDSSPAIGSDGTIYVGSWDYNLYAIEGSSGGLADTPWPMFHHDLKHTGRVTILDTGCIEGYVNDMDSNPIRWALVIARKEPVREIALTDVTGFYEIMDLEPGEYLVLAYKKGYRLGFAKVTVLPGDCSYLGFQLKPKAGEDGEDEIPDLANFPNPFNPDTWIPYLVTDDADVTIRIRDASGRLIRTLNLGRKPAGFYASKDKAAYWDGRSEAGEEVANGIYFYTIQAGEFTATRKMVIAR